MPQIENSYIINATPAFADVFSGETHRPQERPRTTDPEQLALWATRTHAWCAYVEDLDHPPLTPSPLPPGPLTEKLLRLLGDSEGLGLVVCTEESESVIVALNSDGTRMLVQPSVGAPPPLLRPDQLATALSVSLRTVKRLVADRAIPVIYVGKQMRFDWRAVKVSLREKRAPN